MPSSAGSLITYRDPLEGFPGWLALSGAGHELAAGGLRVQPGLTGEVLTSLAEVMARKQRLLGLAVDGAKAGIAYDPASPGKQAAIGRFLGFLRPHLAQRLSLGPDMGTTWPEIESAARSVGISSVKMAIARAQGLDEAAFSRRIRLLDHDLDGLSLAQRRAGHALAHAALAAGRATRCGRTVQVALQGFGTLARGAACSLWQAGAVVTALADEHACIVDERGLDVDALLSMPQGNSLRSAPVGTPRPPRSLFGAPMDVLILAACEDGLEEAEARRLETGAVVVGANLGLSAPAEHRLHQRSVFVVPDFVGGCGGSASMDAIFGAQSCPSPQRVLDDVAERMDELVSGIRARAEASRLTPRDAALQLCQRKSTDQWCRPYGRWEAQREQGRRTA